LSVSERDAGTSGVGKNAERMLAQQAVGQFRHTVEQRHDEIPRRPKIPDFISRVLHMKAEWHLFLSAYAQTH